MKAYRITILIAILLLAACSREAVEPSAALRLRISFSPFEGEEITRTNLEGSGWEGRESFRMKIICPHTTDHQNGEFWSSAYYNITFPAGETTTFVSGPHGSNESQATTYIYTAQNTSDTIVFVHNNYRYSHPGNCFHADQRKAGDFKSSDIVWAQGIRQTGALEVHLNFRHKVAKLKIALDETNLSEKFSEDAVLRLSGMPDIDGAEIVVGDYYADMAYESESFCYRQKASCSYENNSRVLGIEVLNDESGRSGIATLSGGPEVLGGKYSKKMGTVSNTGVYTAYFAGIEGDRKQYLLYVPPCVLETPATFHITDGQRHFSSTLSVTAFEEGKVYPLLLTFSDTNDENI